MKSSKKFYADEKNYSFLVLWFVGYCFGNRDTFSDTDWHTKLVICLNVKGFDTNCFLLLIWKVF